MSVAAQGEQQLIAYYDQVVALTKQTAQWIADQDDMTLAVMPETNILCFQVGEGEARQFAIRKELLARGDFYISTTAYQGARWLRLVFMSSNTQWRHIEQLMADIRAINATI